MYNRDMIVDEVADLSEEQIDQLKNTFTNTKHNLMQAWLYHMVVQLVTMPQDKWIAPLADENVPGTVEYPNKFCDVLCTVEATMIHQLALMRAGFGEEYCNEDNPGKDDDSSERV